MPECLIFEVKFRHCPEILCTPLVHSTSEQTHGLFSSLDTQLFEFLRDILRARSIIFTMPFYAHKREHFFPRIAVACETSISTKINGTENKKYEEDDETRTHINNF